MFKSVKSFMTKEEFSAFSKGVGLYIVDAILNATIFSFMFLTLFQIIDNTLSMQKVLLYGAVILTVSILRVYTTKKSYIIMQSEAASSIAAFRIRVGDHIRKLNMGYFNKNNVGNLTSIMTNDIGDYERMITSVLPTFMKLVVLLIYLLIIMLTMFPGIGYLHTAVILINVPIGIIATKAITKSGQKSKVIRAEMISKIIEYAKGIELFKSYHLVGDSFKKLNVSLLKIRNQSISLELTAIPYIGAMQIITQVSLPLMMLYAVKLYTAESLTQTNLVIYLVAALAITNIAKNVILNYIEMSYFVIGVERLKETINKPSIDFVTEDFKPMDSSVSFADVDFSYVEDKQVLKDINLEVASGSRVAIVGASGSGKSTILNLIARFWDPDKGTIKVGGINTKDVFPDALLSRISMVFQDVYLINDTVIENIRVGNPNATDEDVIEAAKTAHAHEFIMALPDGYQTLLAESGGNLSGGEKQRISIARALLKDADIILLDEATASLDVDNEAKIQNALSTLTSGKTEIVIAHRLNTIKNADLIIVVDEGKIIETGSHQQLMNDKGSYHRMYSKLAAANQWSI